MAPTGEGQRIELLNLPHGGAVHQRLFLLCGRVYSGTPRDAQANPNGPDGYVDIDLADSSRGGPSFGPHSWEVNATWFKALVPLIPGNNRLRITHRWADQQQPSGVSLDFDLTYKPKLDRPPLHLVIVAAKDSPVWSTAVNEDEAQAQQPPNSASNSSSAAHTAPTIPPRPPKRSSGFGGFLKKRRKKEGKAPRLTSKSDRPKQPALIDTPPGWRRDRFLSGGLAEVKRRFALQALTWQAYHADQMHRQGFGHRSFALPEYEDTRRSQAQGSGGSHLDVAELPVVHILRSQRTLAEFRDANNAQQNFKAKNGGAMHSFAGEARKSADLSEEPEMSFAGEGLSSTDFSGEGEMKARRRGGGRAARVFRRSFKRLGRSSRERASSSSAVRSSRARASSNDAGMSKPKRASRSKAVLPGSACAVLILDSTWDPSVPLLRAHAAVGSHGGLTSHGTSHGVMGSHWLWATPSHLSEVTPAFLDQEVTDARYCCNDLGEGRTASLTINIGSGAMLHEVGHAFDNPHWPSGIMARGYIEWNRAFMTRETHSLRGGNRPKKPITPEEDSRENHLHRCQAIRARLHPAFALDGDQQPAYRGHFNSWDDWAQVEPGFVPTKDGIRCNSAAGLAMIVVEVGDGRGGEKKYKTHLEIGLDPSLTPPTSFLMTPAHLSGLVGFDVLSPASPDVGLSATAWNLRHAECNSYRRMGLATPLAVPGVDMARFGREVRNGPRTKVDDDPKHRHEVMLLNSSWRGGPPLVAVELFAHHAFAGVRFRFADGSMQSVGRATGAPKAAVQLQVGEEVKGIEVRSGWWIDAASVRVGPAAGGAGAGVRESAMVGGSGGGRRSLKPASDDEVIVGFVASSGSWMDSLGILVADRM